MRAPAAIAGFLIAVPLCVPGVAQVSNLDQTTFIDTLAEEGMSELLLHYIESEPTTDPVVRAQIEIAQHRLRYANIDLPQEERVAAYEAALRRLRELIAELPEHEQRPIWQTDLAEMLLFEYLPGVHQNAALFYEFGVPTPEQREAYERSVVEALSAASAANLRFFQLQSTLPRDPEHVAKRVNTGLWSRMIDEYFRKRTPYFLAHAAHFVSLLPEGHGYYTSPNNDIAEKQADPERERRRLIEQAQSMVQPFATDVGDAAGVRTSALALLGRVQLQQGQAAAAIETLTPVISADADGPNGLAARLGVAQALTQQKKFPDALDRLADTEAHPLVRDNLLLRLLVTDAAHRTLLAQAETAPADKRARATAAAYDPYLRMLDDPSLGDQAEALRSYVYARWAASSPAGADVSTLPPVVRMAIGEMARIEGQNAAIEAEENGDPASQERALEQLQRAVALSEPLTTPETSEAVRARAMYNLALAKYFADPQGLQGILDATEMMVRLAAEMPAQPMAEEAIGNAVALLRQAHSLEPQPPGIDDAYRKAVAVLFEEFPTSVAADNERLYYGYFVLGQAGEYEAAADVLSRVPPDHPDYMTAQREMLFALEDAMGAAEGEEAGELRQTLRDRAQQVREEAEASDSPEARSALAAVRLVLFGAAIAEGNVDEALRQLEGFEDQFSDQPEMVRLALGRRIIGLAQAGEMDRLTRSSQAMMAQYPDDAAAVIDEVLLDLDPKIEALRTRAATAESQLARADLEREASRLADTASLLSDLLVSWAQGQGYRPEEMLPYQLVRAKSLVLAGQPTQAVEVTTGLVSRFPDDAQVMSAHADALFATGQETELIKAAGFYDRLIQGLTAPYPDMWWNAWLRRLQINDRLNQAVADIPLRVRQLKQTDPNLGGPRYREAFERLAEKHGG